MLQAKLLTLQNWLQQHDTNNNNYQYNNGYHEQQQLTIATEAYSKDAIGQYEQATEQLIMTTIQA